MEEEDRQSIPTVNPVEVKREPQAELVPATRRTGALFVFRQRLCVRNSVADLIVCTCSPSPSSPPTSVKQPNSPAPGKATTPLNARATAFTPTTASLGRPDRERSEGTDDQHAPAGVPRSGQSPATPEMGTPDQPIAGAIPIEPGRISPALKAAQSEQGGQATAEMLRKTIKSALNSLGRGLVSTAYAELPQAVSPESPMPDEKLEEDLEQVAGLVAEARRLMKGFDGKQVLQKLDAADKLHREIASKLVKDASTSSAGFASQRLRLRAHAKLSEYEEVDRLSE